MSGTRQGCIISTSVVNAYSENMINEAIGGNRNKMSIGNYRIKVKSIKAVKLRNDQSIVFY